MSRFCQLFADSFVFALGFINRTTLLVLHWHNLGGLGPPGSYLSLGLGSMWSITRIILTASRVEVAGVAAM